MFGAIEAGGTKFVCAVGTCLNDLHIVNFPTTAPEETLSKCFEFFDSYKENLRAIGIGSFGPIDLNLQSASYGYITDTPKAGWSNTDFVGPFRQRYQVPVAFDTDVNVAAVGEFVSGAAQGVKNFIYITIGTGIGGGAMVNGQLVHGLVHTEMGHIFLVKHERDSFQGSCPFHGDRCFEGLASGPAIEARWHARGENLGDDHIAWKIESDYIAKALINYTFCYSPEMIVLGGSISLRPGIIELVRKAFLTYMGGYIKHDRLSLGIDQYIVLPGLKEQAGIYGALKLAENMKDPF